MMGAKESLLLLISTSIWCVSAEEDATANFGGSPLASGLQQFQNPPPWHRHLQQTMQPMAPNGTNPPASGNATEMNNCQLAGLQFTCVSETFFNVGEAKTEIIYSVTCDLNPSIGFMIDESSGCVCDAMLNEINASGNLTGVKNCACSTCPDTANVDYSLDCSGADPPFAAPGCEGIDCDGRCLQPGMSGNMTMMPGTNASQGTTPPGSTTTAPGATTSPTTPGATVSPTAPEAPATNSTTAPGATPPPTVAGNNATDTNMQTNGTSTDMPSNNMTTTAPTSKPTYAPRTDCFVRNQAGSGGTIKDGSIVCEGSDGACAGGVVANCHTVTCGERDCTQTTILNATKVICTGESSCYKARIGEEDNPVETVHCQGKDWACYQANIFANTTIICEDNSGECKVKENGICGFANLSTPCLQCIGTNHGCGPSEGCKLGEEACPEYRYGGQTCEAACPADNECKMNDTVHKCGDAESGASSVAWDRLVQLGVTAITFVSSFLML